MLTIVLVNGILNAAMKIGENILKIREEKNLKRSALVNRLRFIYGDNAIDYRTIERIERGDMAKGRLSSLLQLADALGVNVTDFYKGTEFEDKTGSEEKLEEAYVTRADARGGIFNYSKNASIEIVSPDKSSYVMFLLVLEPDGRTKLEQDPVGTVKFLFVTKGELKVNVGNIERTLYKGDSIQINSNKPHYFANTSKKRSTVLLYQSPKNF
jgi:quercetin dioxygenase-like cupin family protein